MSHETRFSVTEVENGYVLLCEDITGNAVEQTFIAVSPGELGELVCRFVMDCAQRQAARTKSEEKFA